jgi:hypothetical protein
MIAKETWTDGREQILNPSESTGLIVASDPFQYTIDYVTHAINSGYCLSIEQAMQTLDKVSDEIGITHELAEGEVD